MLPQSVLSEDCRLSLSPPGSPTSRTKLQKNFLSGCAGGPGGFGDSSATDVGAETPESQIACRPHIPGPAAFKVPAVLAAPPSLAQEWGQQRRSPPRLSICLTPTNSSSPAVLSRGSSSTVFQLPLPGRPPRLPQAWTEGRRKEQKVPYTKASGTAEMKPLWALTVVLRPPALALRLLGAHSAPPRRPGAAFRTRCVWTAPPGAQPPSGGGGGLTCQSRFIKPIRAVAAGAGPKHLPIG